MSAANLKDSNHMIDCQPASFVGARYIGGNLIKSLDGKSPQVHPSAFVSEAAYVIGDVEIGEGSSIWPGVVIRADMGKIKIGSNTCIQDNSVVHGDADVEIGNRVVIGHKVLCHARKVGNRVMIGSGATVNDGVEIGDYSLIASGSMVIDEMKVPERSLVVGLPARIRGAVEERHTRLIDSTCESYIHKTKRYKQHGDLE